jgi:tetratricopeptide (TPR) repeat protein
VSALLLRWEDARERGECLSPEELCRDSPEHLPEVRRQVEALGAVYRMIDVDLPAPQSAPDPYATTTEDKETPAPCAAALGGWPFVPGYELLGQLGRGGMGIVYKARQTRLKRLVALKMILGAHAFPDNLERFRTEAEAIARLQHPNIVQIYEVGEHDGRPFLSLEFVDGGSLDKKLAAAPQPPREAAQLVETLARALHAAHERGVVHRDLKPANVLITSDGTPKVTDFGLAKRLDDESSRTRSGLILGTPSYMAPEQAAGDTPAIGPVTDVYALGTILYETLTGRPPFRGATMWETLDQVRTQEPVPPSRLQPNVPRDLETITLKCLRKDAGRRYASAAELADDLRRFLDRKPIVARPVGTLERLHKWARRKPAAAGLVAACCLLLLGGVTGLVLYARYQDEQVSLARRDLEREVSERRRVDGLRGEAQGNLVRAQEARARKDWQGVKVHVSRVLGAVGSEARLADLRGPAENLQAEADEGLAAEAAEAQVKAKLPPFAEFRDKAIFHSFQVNPVDLATNTAETRNAARQALALFAPLDAPARPPEKKYLSAAEHVKVTADCYELLLVLAEATAQPLAGETAESQVRAALRILDRAPKVQPPTRVYHLRRADYLSRLQNEAGAAKERELAASPNLGSPRALDHFLTAHERYQQNDLSRALLHLDNAIEREPGHFWAQFLKAICCLRSQPVRAQEARAALTACMRERKEFVWLYLLRGAARTELGRAALNDIRLPVTKRRAEADFHFRTAYADFNRSAQLLERKPDKDGSYVLAVNRGVLRLQEGKLEEAVRDFRQAMMLKPGGVSAYVNLAVAYERQKKLDDAVRQLDKAIKLQPESAALYRARARLHSQHNDTAAALSDLDQAIARERPTTAAALRLLAEDHKERGRIFLTQGKYNEAAAAFRKAFLLNPNYPVATRLLAETLIEQKRYDEAAELLTRYLDGALRNLDGYLKSAEPVAAAYRLRGVARSKLSHPAAALDDYTRALEIEPNSATYAYRGWLYVVTEAPKLALRDFEEAIRLDGKNADAHNGRGYARVLLGQYRLAVDDAEEALRLGRKETRLLYNAARIYAQAAARVESELGAADRRAREQAGRYQDRAARLLREALGLLDTDVDRRRFWREVRTDLALVPLHRNRLFAALSAEMKGQ